MQSSLFTLETDATPQATAATGWSDWVGMAASIGCAIHCAAMPFVIAYLPALGLSFLADEAFHKWMALACFVIAVTAFIPGFRKHGRLTPVVVGCIGLVMITFAAFGFAGECCPSCASETAGSVTPVAASTGEAVCTDTACPHCASGDAAAVANVSGASAESVAAVANAESSWLAPIAPWLTPLGGLVLVSAHLLNHRYGCACGCCNLENSEEAAR